MTNDVVIVGTGTANLASVRAAFQRLGHRPVMAEGADEIRHAERVVVPGVGSFGASLERIREQGLAEALSERIRQGHPTLGFCVGHQVMFRTSEESPGAEGLGAVDGHVSRFPSHVHAPQFGWNHISIEGACRYLRDGYAYFANSYRVETIAEGIPAAFALHGGRFLAAFEQGDVVGCQFHPELSGAWGQAFLARWLGHQDAS